ncbi:MAG: HIRAN domain-containing protein [Ruminococcus sp.]|nr:HIRAN domain-containing protein [Ruminococcus sp.]
MKKTNQENKRKRGCLYWLLFGWCFELAYWIIFGWWVKPLLLLNKKLKEKNELSQQSTKDNSKSENQFNAITAPNQAPKFINGIPLNYNYKHEKLCQIRGQEPDISKLKVGQEVSLLPEPQNQYDKNAIAVYHENDKIGYLYRGYVQDIANRFNNDIDAEIFCFICEINGNDVFLNIGFYQEKRELLNKETTFKLIRTSSKEIQETIDDCVSEEDEVYFSYDYEKELFEICPTGCSFAIGYAPKSKSSLLESLEESDEYRAYVSEIEEDDNGKYSVYVTIEYEE